MTTEAQYGTGGCAFCDSEQTVEIMNFGRVALAGGFLRDEDLSRESKYPLTLIFCTECFALQVKEKIDPNKLFQDYFYFSSVADTLKTHFTKYAREVASRFLDPSASVVVELGCNDGVLLRPLADLQIKTIIGVDPATNVIGSINDSRIKVINTFFNEEVANKITQEHGVVDMILANNVFAHIADIQGTTKAIAKTLSKNGVFIFEAHYLGNMLNELQYDMIYHEHLYYYSLISLQKFFGKYGLSVFDVERVPTHAGSMRFYVCKEGSVYSKSPDKRVEALLLEEKKNGFECIDTYRKFARDVTRTRNDLLVLLDRLKSQGKSIVGYGASGRASTVMQYCGLGSQYLDFIIDDATAKIGCHTPGSHLLIKPRSTLDGDNPPDYVILFAWSFFDEISMKCQSFLDRGGQFILPLPTVQLVSKHTKIK